MVELLGKASQGQDYHALQTKRILQIFPNLQQAEQFPLQTIHRHCEKRATIALLQ